LVRVSATEVLTAVLVLVTGYYAWQNRGMVKEMQATRKVTVFPKLALEWTMPSPTLGFPTIRNVGPGPALDVEIEVRLVPLPGHEEQQEVRRWTASVIAPAEAREFIPPRKGKSGAMKTEDMAATYRCIQLTGSYTDVLGEQHVADDELSDIDAWHRITGEAEAHWVHPDPVKRLAKELAETLAKEFKSSIDAIARGVNQ
jgi:hypothetical protein